MLRVENISKRFKSDFWSTPFWALQKITFQINSGEVVGFLGANGAGKTTLTKIIMDLIRPTEGTVEFSFEHTLKRPNFSQIGYLPERPYFYPNLTGWEFMHYLGALNDLTTQQIKEGGKLWGERLMLDHALNRKLKTYSKGMLQRLGIMTTLLHRPKFIMLDEPLSGLDPIGRKEIKDILVEIHKQQGSTIFFSTHIVPDVEEICQKVVFIEKGQMIFFGGIEDLLGEQKNQRLEEVLYRMNRAT